MTALSSTAAEAHATIKLLVFVIAFFLYESLTCLSLYAKVSGVTHY